MSFRPWWSAFEARTVCFVIDSLKDSLYFYADVDTYPLNYMTDLFDDNGILVIDTNSPYYTVANWVFGTFYIRVRPVYDFSSVITDDANTFDFYAFSQPPEGVVTDLYGNQTVMGVADTTKLDNQYRHFLTSPNETIVVTLTGIYGRGNPILMVKAANSQSVVTAGNEFSYDWRDQVTD